MKYTDNTNTPLYEGLVCFNSTSGATLGHAYTDIQTFYERWSKFVFSPNETNIWIVASKGSGSYHTQILCNWAIESSSIYCRQLNKTFLMLKQDLTNILMLNNT